MAPMASTATTHSHRPSTSSKQTNKAFKTKHASKGSLKDAAKGRTHRPILTSASKKKTNATLSAAHLKLNRRNHAKQLQLLKAARLEALGQLFSSRKGADRVSRIIAVVPMTEDVDPLVMVQNMLHSVGVECVGETDGVRTADVVKFHNQTLRFVMLPPASSSSSLFPILDGCAVADFVLIGLSSEMEVNEQGETALRCLTGTGVGASGGVLGVVASLPSSATLASSTRASLHSFLTHFFPTLDRVSNAASASEGATIVRGLCEKVPKGMRWREARPRILAEGIEWSKNVEVVEGQETESLGTLCIEGVVRGSRLAADRLVHLQGFGDFIVEKITAAPSARPSKSSNIDFTMAEALALLSIPTNDADDLAATNVPDDEDLLLGEQTWPTADELAHGAAQPRPRGMDEMEGDMLPPALPGTTPKRVVRRVPKGTSAYQAAWIIDEEEEDAEDFDEEYEDIVDDAASTNGGGAAGGEVSDFVDDTASVSARPFADLDPEQEAQQLASYLAQRGRERALQNRDDLDFPDEIDTPLHIPARERFARYRGMRSFRTSPWDAFEELPQEYSRCFMFEDFRGMGRKMERKAAKEGVEAGTRVILHLKNVPRAVIDAHDPSHPFIAFGLLKHEHKYSVTHFTVQRNTEYTDTVRSKDPLVLLLGPRRFLINPIFSQHTARGGGRGINNVHKLEKFLRHGINATIATAYLPITFGTQPAVLLRVPSSLDDPTIHLVGSGTLLSSDPTRITAKRLILTGHPFKVHKKTATIRYMFFNEPDVAYYQPIQLRTKRGRTGHIRMSLGTHGYFKAGFDGPIDQMDQICLYLYKRCFPKWGSVWKGGLVTNRVQGEAEADLGEHRFEEDVEME